MIGRLVVLLIALCPGAAFAQGAALTLDEVLQSSARSAPQIVEALAKVRQAEGKGISAD
ncbi:multidrug transporter, partial [Xanthomonas perforans]|nr:multidrug transporter [Xanthomonas perforans]